MRAVANWIVGAGLLLGAMSATAADGTAPLLTDADTAAASSASTDSSADAATISEVEVSAQAEHEAAVKALQDQQDVPRSVSIVTGRELESLDALNITEVYERLG